MDEIPYIVLQGGNMDNHTIPIHEDIEVKVSCTRSSCLLIQRNRADEVVADISSQMGNSGAVLFRKKTRRSGMPYRRD